MLFNNSWLDHGPEFIPYLIIFVGSWAFWTLCAGIIWRMTRGPDEGAPPPSRQARLNLGKPRS
jgi:hypothetical protein